MGENEIERWVKIRRRGRKRFLVRKTITFALIPGVVTIAWCSWESIWTGALEFSSINYRKELFSTVVFALWGFMETWFLWKPQEDRYRASAETVDLK